MTYHDKIILKRAIKFLGISILVISLFLLIGFTYLSRFLVYTQDGTYFNFNLSQHLADASETLGPVANPPPLVTGEPIELENAATGVGGVTLASTEISGLLIDYETLKEGSSLSTVDLSDCNTLMLEMRVNGSEILSSESVLSLIERAQKRSMYLIALMSCLDDNDFALENADDALQITGGALWMSSSGSYYLNPESENVQDYIVSYINSLQDMGFNEIVLENFSFPLSSTIATDADEETRGTILQDSFNAIRDRTNSRCPLGILVNDPDTGHQAYDVADRVYIYFSSGTELADYVDAHSGYHLIFITNSHDTRFDSYGKITTEISFSENAAEEDENFVNTQTQNIETQNTEADTADAENNAISDE